MYEDINFHRAAVADHIAKSFINDFGSEDTFEKGKWNVGDTKVYQGVTWEVGGFNAKGTPLWRKKKDQSSSGGSSAPQASQQTSSTSYKNPAVRGKQQSALQTSQKPPLLVPPASKPNAPAPGYKNPAQRVAQKPKTSIGGGSDKITALKKTIDENRKEISELETRLKEIENLSSRSATAKQYYKDLYNKTDEEITTLRNILKKNRNELSKLESETGQKAAPQSQQSNKPAASDNSKNLTSIQDHIDYLKNNINMTQNFVRDLNRDIVYCNGEYEKARKAKAYGMKLYYKNRLETNQKVLDERNKQLADYKKQLSDLELKQTQQFQAQPNASQSTATQSAPAQKPQAPAAKTAQPKASVLVNKVTELLKEQVWQFNNYSADDVKEISNKIQANEKEVKAIMGIKFSEGKIELPNNIKINIGHYQRYDTSSRNPIDHENVHNYELSATVNGKNIREYFTSSRYTKPSQAKKKVIGRFLLDYLNTI